jgi:hypothetical protein
VRPIREPGPIGRIAESQFAIRQLQRRPSSTTSALPYAFATTAGSQLIDTSSELMDVNGGHTNASDIFEVSASKDGILISVAGFYEVRGWMETVSATQKFLYTQVQPDSSYPTFGTEWGAQSGGFAFDLSLLHDTATRLVHIGVGPVTSPLPMRAVLVHARPSSNYTVTTAGLIVTRIGDYNP